MKELKTSNENSESPVVTIENHPGGAIIVILASWQEEDLYHVGKLFHARFETYQ